MVAPNRSPGLGSEQGAESSSTTVRGRGLLALTTSVPRVVPLTYRLPRNRRRGTASVCTQEGGGGGRGRGRGPGRAGHRAPRRGRTPATKRVSCATRQWLAYSLYAPKKRAIPRMRMSLEVLQSKTTGQIAGLFLLEKKKHIVLSWQTSPVPVKRGGGRRNHKIVHTCTDKTAFISAPRRKRTFLLHQPASSRRSRLGIYDFPFFSFPFFFPTSSCPMRCELLKWKVEKP